MRISRQQLLRHEKRLNKLGFRAIAGVDEAGRGPLAGPVVASAVILGNFRFKEEIFDSKKLSHKKRLLAYNEILANATAVGIGIVGEKTIDEINIYQATLQAMRMALTSLKLTPDYAIVDGNMNLGCLCPSQSIVKGDCKSLSIAAASIVAKVTRDNIMFKFHSEYPQYGFSRHKGYPTKDHKRALKEHGPSPIHRFTFQPVKDLI